MGRLLPVNILMLLDARLVVVVIRLRLASRLERYVLFPLSIMVSLKRVICVEMLV